MKPRAAKAPGHRTADAKQAEDAARSAAAEPDSGFDGLDRASLALIGQLTGGISPTALALAWADWASHLALAPGRRAALAAAAARDAAALSAYATNAAAGRKPEAIAEPPPHDRRFADERWRQWPFSVWAQAFLTTQRWWDEAAHDVPGVDPHHGDVVAFVGRQLLDAVAPSSLPWTNPEVIDATLRSGGRNLVRGTMNAVEDMLGHITGTRPGASGFEVGRDVAVTPGKVVFRNRLIELIQFAPTTPTVHREPVLVIPAWIMKYYILDLSPHNSLIRWLVGKGHTVFAISWRNVTAEDRDLGFDDYRRLGVMAALDAVSDIVPGPRVHALGYCLGGTLLTIAAAAMARAGDDRLTTMSLLAAQTDFTGPGELQIFMDHSQVALVEAMMWQRGFLAGDQMARFFQLLRSSDLVWSRLVRDYLIGERAPLFDLMAWNADTTRMPYRMHSEYLRRFFLGNDLAAGRIVADGRRVAIQDIRVPILAVATEQDHVSPWRSVYKVHYLADTEVTFVLTSGGHNAGIVSEPGHPHRHYRLRRKGGNDPILAADEWFAATDPRDGSWWEAWQAWLAAHSAKQRIAPPAIGNPDRDLPPLMDAPGSYVLQG